MEDSIITSPVECWRAWITQIARDPEMDKDRVMRHLQRHIGKHMPNADAPKERWEEWLGGSYNLLAILGCMVGIDPKHDVGVDLLFRKWISDPSNHTPPPKKKTKKVTSCKNCGQDPTKPYSGS